MTIQHTRRALTLFLLLLLPTVAFARPRNTRPRGHVHTVHTRSSRVGSNSHSHK